MSANLDAKLERKEATAWQAVSAVLERPSADPIWRDEQFWMKRWPALVDRAGEATDRAAAARSKARA